MRITNIEKFREEMYKAIEGTYEWMTNTPSAVFKSGVEYKDSMTEYNHSGIVNDEPHVISLARPMEIEGKKELYITVDEDGVSFWRSENEYFEFDGYMDFDIYTNKLSFIAALVLRIANKIEK